MMRETTDEKRFKEVLILDGWPWMQRMGLEDLVAVSKEA
jgi:hypothetical protein